MAKNYDLRPENQRFGELFRQANLSQKEFGELLGVSQRQISAILLGRSLITPMLIELLRYKLNINPSWLLHGELPKRIENPEWATGYIPILADIPAGPWKLWIDTYVTGVGDDYIAAPTDIKGENLFAIRVKGDSMEPSLHEGDILVINPHREFISGLAVVRHHWGYKIRMAKKHNNTYILTPLNLAYKEEEIEPDNDTRFYVPVKRISMQNLSEGDS